MGSSPNYRGEISQIVDEMFINYSLELPEDELASTSGYFMKGSPFRYSYFTVERGATSQREQTTKVYKIDPTNGNKTDELLAALTWSSGGSKDVCLGLITGYNLPKEWEDHLAPPYISCYVSVASVRKRGIGRNQDDELDLHTARIRELNDAVLTIYLPTLPESIAINDLRVYRNSHATQQAAHDHVQANVAPAPPPALPAMFDSSIRSMVIGAPGEPLQTGLYVIAKPIAAGEHHNLSIQQQPYGHHA